MAGYVSFGGDEICGGVDKWKEKKESAVEGRGCALAGCSFVASLVDGCGRRLRGGDWVDLDGFDKSLGEAIKSRPGVWCFVCAVRSAARRKAIESGHVE